MSLVDLVGSPAAHVRAWAETHVAHSEMVLNSAGVASAASGLVSVPTTPTRGLDASLSHASVKGDAKELQKLLGAFALDRSSRRASGLRMAVGFAARAHAVSEKGHRTDKAWLVTLTYAGTNDDWRAEHMTRAMDAYRVWCKREGFACRYVWVAELQKRGVIHYHVAAWLPVGVCMPKWDERGWWHCGMSNRIEARSATAYLMSYLKKGDLEARGSLPKGARNYGVGGLDHSLRRARRWLRLPSFVQANSSIHDAWNRATGGGWTSPDGRHFVSEFAQVSVGGVRCLARVARHERSIEAAGPFSWCGDRAASFAHGGRALRVS